MITHDSKPVILVVDDEPLVVLAIEDCLEDSGCEVIAAKNFAGAIDMLVGREDIAIVVTDIKMPGSLDGLDLLNTVADRWPSKKVIIMTGDTFNPDIPEGIRTFRKPFMLSDLASALRQLTSGSA